jgi:hypothetical protein
MSRGVDAIAFIAHNVSKSGLLQFWRPSILAPSKIEARSAFQLLNGRIGGAPTAANP